MAPGSEWYELIEGDALEQGDILASCPVFRPPEDLAAGLEGNQIAFEWEERTLVVMSQSCDLANSKVQDVLLCAVYSVDQITEGYLATDRGKEDCRRGNLPAYHLIANCDIREHRRPISVVDFRRVYSLPINYVRRRAEEFGARLRLLPPYKEHLSQAFARYFMRVGLPENIPPFRK